MPRFTLTLVIVCLAAAGISRCAARAAPGRRLAAVPRHRGAAASRKGSRCRSKWNAADGDERRVEDADSRPGSVEPDRVGRRGLHLDLDQRQDRREPEGRPLRRHHAGAGRHAPRVARLRARQEDRQGEVAADGLQGRAEDQAPHEEQPRELDAGDRRRAHRRVLRVGGPVRLRHEGQARCGRRTSACSTPGSTWCPRRSGKRAARRSFTTAW